MFCIIKLIEIEYLYKKERNVRHEKNYGGPGCADQCVFARRVRHRAARHHSRRHISPNNSSDSDHERNSKRHTHTVSWPDPPDQRALDERCDHRLGSHDDPPDLAHHRWGEKLAERDATVSCREHGANTAGLHVSQWERGMGRSFRETAAGWDHS